MQTRKELADEKRSIEKALAGIRSSKQAKELEVLKKRLPARDEFSALKQISIQSRQESQALHERLAEITAALSGMRDNGEHPMAEVASLLREIRDLLKQGAAGERLMESSE